jgi:hypothetical protein
MRRGKRRKNMVNEEKKNRRNRKKYEKTKLFHTTSDHMIYISVKTTPKLLIT